MNAAQIPTPEAGDNPGDEIPSFSPSARESASNRREKTAACSGDTLMPGNENPERTLASVSPAPAAAAPSSDVTESPEGDPEPDRPVEEPRSHMPTRALAAVSKHKVFPSFMRRYIDMASASGPEMDQPRPLPEAHFVPRALRGTGTVTRPITPSQASPVGASVTPVVTAGSICPTCHCRVPARASAAERQKAYRERKREQRNPVVP